MRSIRTPFAYYVGRRCRQATIQDVAHELNLHWDSLRVLEMHSMRAQLARAGTPGPKAIGIVVSDLFRKRPLWFGEAQRKAASLALFCDWLGEKKTRGIGLAVMDMCKPILQWAQAGCTAGGNSVRQVSHHAASGRCARRSAQVRVAQTQRSGAQLHQGSEIHVGVASRESHATRPPGTHEGAHAKQAIEYGLPARGILGSTLGLRERGLGATILPDLAGKPEVAATQTL